jgi:surface protein
MISAFDNAVAFNQDLSSWDTSSVKNMARAFRGATNFTGQGLSSWDVSQVQTFNAMFHSATSAVENLSSWNVAAATDMRYMFFRTTSFQFDLSNWDVSNNQQFAYMFGESRGFDLSKVKSWSVSKGTEFDGMFKLVESFNTDLSGWDVSSGVSFSEMFEGATSFSQNLCAWEDSLLGRDLVTSDMFIETACESQLDAMFTSQYVGPLCGICQPTPCDAVKGECQCFNSDEEFQRAVQDYFRAPDNQQNPVAATYGYPIGNWCTTEVTSMANTFRFQETFNEDLSCWNTENVVDMTNMFRNAIAFNQPLDTWITSKVEKMVRPGARTRF